MAKSDPIALLTRRVKDACFIDRLQWAARYLQSRHEIGDFARVSTALEDIGGAYSRFMVLEMMLKFVTKEQHPQELLNLRESLTGEVFAAIPLSKRRERLVIELAAMHLIDFVDD